MKMFPIMVFCLASFYTTKSIAGEPFYSQVIGWGQNSVGQATGVPTDPIWATNSVTVNGHFVTNCIAVSAGPADGYALESGGTVVGWGNHSDRSVINSPLSALDWAKERVHIGDLVLSNVSMISTWGQNLALLKDGTLATWDADAVQAAAPRLNDVVGISSGSGKSLVVKRDGTVVTWPSAVPLQFSNIVSVAVTRIEYGDNIALMNDGRIIQWNRGFGSARTPAGLSNVVAVAAGGRGGEDVALRKDGSVVDLPYNSPVWSVHSGLSNVVAIAAGGSQCMALNRDGTVVAWGGRFPYTATVPEGLSNIVAIAAGQDFCLAITTNSAVAEKFRH